MSKPFIWQEPFLQNKDGTEYTLISDQHITVTELDGEEVIKIAPEALTLLARQAFYEASFSYVPLICNRSPAFLTISRPAVMINTLRCSYYVMLKSQQKGYYPTVRIPAPQLLLPVKGNRYGPEVTTPKP